MTDIRFTVNVYDYENDRDANLTDWRDDDRFDLLTDLAMALFSVDVVSHGVSSQTPREIPLPPGASSFIVKPRRAE